MSDRGPAAPPPGMAVTDQQIAEALESVLRGSNAFNSPNDVVHLLESKLGVDLSHKYDFIGSQIRHFFLLQSQPQNFMPHHHHHHQKDHFTLHQNPNFLHSPSPHLPPNYAVPHPTESYGFRPAPPSQPQLSQPPPVPPVATAAPSVAAAGVAAKESNIRSHQYYDDLTDSKSLNNKGTLVILVPEHIETDNDGLSTNKWTFQYFVLVLLCVIFLLYLFNHFLKIEVFCRPFVSTCFGALDC